MSEFDRRTFQTFFALGLLVFLTGSTLILNSVMLMRQPPPSRICQPKERQNYIKQIDNGLSKGPIILIFGILMSFSAWKWKTLERD